MSEAKVIELEKKVDTILGSLNLLLFEEAEAVSDKEAKELRGRLDDYLKGRLSEFVTLDEAKTNV